MTNKSKSKITIEKVRMLNDFEKTCFVIKAVASDCRPGEISLAHKGVLFLDEAAEFRTTVLQMLRVPLETGIITLSRAGRSTVFPADFQLVMTANPCPCGNFGSGKKICLCSQRAVGCIGRNFPRRFLTGLR